MNPQYDKLVENYGEVDDVILFYRENVEFPSLLRALGEVAGKRVLDVGCGDGVYARMVQRMGASRVVGVDVSSAMVDLARSEGKEAIEYLVHDVATLPVLGSFDVALAANVLHYAPDRQVLARMCRRVFANLAPGGRLLAFVGNPDCDKAAAAANGFVVTPPDDPREGDPMTVAVPTDPPTVVQVRYWPRETVARVLRASGFAEVTWEPLTSSPAARELDHVQRCVEVPIHLLLTARR
ncbi:class I SAM-dependent methyltransferase [Streptomyces iconiensis]|uniref:Methyltransferase domain-containing protein n=1 Tax=Streptomyces iconiensis TaxID=1384038 RepID=A0ABT6ZRZ4_9ACTN|nr:class I SAM-dependent methyltransferase [Streptomyces iconiensis]MDJ1131411.1 methyltransferase domain-containing protein [Streptomyces iconiensis]